MAKGKTVRPAIWAKIRILGRFTRHQLRLALPGTIHARTIRSYVDALNESGILEVVADGTEEGRKRHNSTYLLARDTGVECPRVRKDGTAIAAGSARENLWRTMKIMKTFGVADLVVRASTEEHPVSGVSASEYICRLARVGYVRRLTKNGVRARYQLVRHTGPCPPQLKADGTVFDPNTGNTMDEWVGCQ